MQRVAVLILVVACCALTAQSLAEDTNKSKPSSSMSSAEAFQGPTVNPKPNTTTTTTKPTTPTPTTKTTTNSTTPTPTTKTTTNSTTPTPTTKTTTNSTTPKPTTPKTTTPKPTTPKPTTPKTTTPKPTTAPTPTPPTNLTVGNYTLMTGKEVCLKAQMAIQIRLETQKSNGTFIVQPLETKTSGGCMENKANLTISFGQGFITFLFNKDSANKTVYVDGVSFDLSYPFTKTGTQRYNANNGSVHLFAAKIGHSYSCREESIYMGSGLYLDVNKDRMQAFNFTKNDFGYPDPCPADQPDYRIAIAVGVTLLVLIIIVLIVYLLGRRRRTAGYQSL